MYIALVFLVEERFPVYRRKDFITNTKKRYLKKIHSKDEKR